jgi:putative Mg2+ transporter-C (MgtC) family protein
MSLYLLSQLELLLRIIIAGLCGALIGYERNTRLKVAGIRTHLVVAMGAALIMVVSKYGFNDVLLLKGVTLDPSRVAAQVVSGIGFLGAGMIFLRKNAISNLTTAAGVWATAGVGLAIGANLYIIGIASTVLLLIAQILLRRRFDWWLKIPVSDQINIRVKDDPGSIDYIREKISEFNIEVLTIKAEKIENGFIDVEVLVKLPQKYDVTTLMTLFKDNSYITSVDIANNM